MELQITKDVTSFLAQIDVIAEEGGLDQLIHDLNMAGKLVGIAKAKALYLREKSWSNEDESFRDYAVREYGIRGETVKRYIDTWEMILQAPESLQPFLVRKPMEQLIPLGTALAQGDLEVDEVDWDQYLGVTSNGEAYAVVGEWSGKEPAERLHLYIDLKTGDISSWYAGQYEHIGYLDVERTDVEQVRKGITRIINKSGLREKENAE